LRLFEIGKAYALRDGEPTEVPVLTLGATGLAREKTIYEDAREFGFADLKGDLDSIGELAGALRWRLGGPKWLAGGRSAQISAGQVGENIALGVAGQLSRRIADQLKLRQEIFVAELRLEPLLAGIEHEGAAPRFAPIPRFPAVERDFSLVLTDGVTFAQVADAIRTLGIPELRNIEAADLFRGGQIPVGKYSLMIRVVFQSGDTTLTEAQVAEFSSRIVTALETKLGASLRAS
jgi:phenylalanyl-tRNA synthetase beta chain